MAVVDDYLAVRPEAEPRLRRLAATGRLAMGPWYALPGRVPRLRRDARPQPAARPRPGGPLRRRHGGRLPARHVRPRRPDAPAARASSGSSTRSCGGACPRPSTAPASGGRRPTAPPCGPSTCRRATATARSCPTTPRRSCAASASSRRSRATCSAGPILWMNGTDHLLPQPWLGRVVAEANALQDGYELAHLARWPSTSRRRADRRTCRVWTRRAALRRPGQPAHGRGVEPGRREAGRGARRARARAAGRAAVGAVPPGRPLAGRASSTRPGSR